MATIKNLLKKEGDPYLALLAYQSTPLVIELSPSQLLIGRTLWSTIIIIQEQRKPEVPKQDIVRERDEKFKERQRMTLIQTMV